MQDEADELARRLGLRRCPDVWLVHGAVSPMVWALGRRPRLLFPAGLLDRLDEAGRAALLAHELAHVRRRDHWVRLLELAATGLYWWLPVLWWARRELHEAEEQCCDAWGVWALGGDGRPYALALLQAAAFVSHARWPLPAGASGGVGQLSHLKRRLEMVMQGKTSRSLSWAGLGVVCGLGLLLLPLFPARGQQPPVRPPAVEPAPADPAKDPRDQEIEVLKRAMQILQEEKALERGSLPLKEAGLEAQLRDVEKAIAGKKKELDDLERKAQDLRTKLKEQGGRPATDSPYNNVHRVHPPAKTAEGRVDDLEKKLDVLQKELEELRRSLKRNPQPALTPPGGYPPATGPTPLPSVTPPPRPDSAPRGDTSPTPPAATPPDPRR